jgi:arylsulfatase A-like enzyme
MKYSRLLIVLAALLEFSTVARADLASIFTNAAPARMAIPRRTSIIFIQYHDLAQGDLSCYGQTNYQTPNLDRLAAEGVRFTHYSGGEESPATTAMLLSGTSSDSVSGEPNLAQRLQQSGYHTGLIGEWTFDREPWRHGFDEFAGFFTDAEAQDYYPENIWRYPHVKYDENNRVQSRFLDHEMLYYNTGGKKGQYVPDLLVTAMDNFVRGNVPDKANHYRPFFLLVNMPAPRSAKTDADDFPVPSDAPFTGEAWPQAAKNRAALITRLDGGIGRLFEQLGKIGMTNNVAIFVSSSSAPEKFVNTNLDSFLPPNNFRSTNNITPLLPMMVRWPKTIPNGQVSGLKWTAADFAPTASEIGYVKPATNFTGVSILPMLRGMPGTNTPALPDRAGLREF